MLNSQNITEVKHGRSYQVLSLGGEDDITTFLFSLGCRVGENIYFKAKRGQVYILVIGNHRYGIDKKIAKNLFVRESEL